ncbi:MAG: hypothetical protein ABUT20_03360 [Bacteroidota bacterium]
MTKTVIFILLSILLLTGCNNSDQVIVKYVDNDPLYFDYKIWGEEDRDYVTVMLQYRLENEEGFTKALRNSAKVECDGALLKADSSKMSGFFYETQKPLDSFAGKHLISYTDSAGKVYNEPFEFAPFTLKKELPETVHRNDLVLQFEGLKDEDYIRVIALDTAFKSRGINEVDTVKNGILIITKNRLKNLVNGRVHLELYKEEEWPVKNATTAGGYLSITYSLKRDFLLAD